MAAVARLPARCPCLPSCSWEPWRPAAPTRRIGPNSQLTGSGGEVTSGANRDFSVNVGDIVYFTTIPRT